MSDRPSAVWKAMPLEKRVRAARAFWVDDSASEIELQRMEAVAAIARRWKFRPQSVVSLPVERRARQLAQLADVSDAIAARALVSYHFDCQRPLMSAFLDALGVSHENGLITAEEMTPPDVDTIRRAVATVEGAFAGEDVALYLRTLAAIDGDTWAGVAALQSA